MKNNYFLLGFFFLLPIISSGQSVNISGEDNVEVGKTYNYTFTLNPEN